MDWNYIKIRAQRAKPINTEKFHRWIFIKFFTILEKELLEKLFLTPFYVSFDWTLVILGQCEAKQGLKT